MELLLLLLIVFLQLGGAGWEWVTARRGPRTPEPPQPCCYRAPGGRSRESHWVVKGTPCREMPALLSLL